MKYDDVVASLVLFAQHAVKRLSDQPEGHWLAWHYDGKGEPTRPDNTPIQSGMTVKRMLAAFELCAWPARSLGTNAARAFLDQRRDPADGSVTIGVDFTTDEYGEVWASFLPRK
jgi:hypothetical protein